MVAIGDSYFCAEGNLDLSAIPNLVIGSVACNLANFTKFLVEKAHLQVPLEQDGSWQEENVHNEKGYRAYGQCIQKAIYRNSIAPVIGL